MDVDRLEAGIELDEIIAEKVMGWRLCQDYYGSQELGTYHWRDNNNNRRGPKGNCRAFFSTDQNTAWQIIERLIGHGHSIHVDYDKDYGIDKRCGWSIAIDGIVYCEFMEKLPLAICIAALKAALAAADTGEER